MKKYCSHCQRSLPRRAFHTNVRTWDQRQTWCKACVRVYQRQRYARRCGYVLVERAPREAHAWPPPPRRVQEG